MLRGSLTDETGLVWKTILDTLANPVRRPSSDDGGAGADPDTGDSERKECTAGQRMHDALLELGERILRSGTLPDAGGAPVTVVVRTDVNGLRDLWPTDCGSQTEGVTNLNTAYAACSDDPVGSSTYPFDEAESFGGIVQTEHGELMRARSLAKLAGDAELIPLLFDRATSNENNDCRLYLGRTQRLANRAQRRALAGRDGGCCFPACSRPASWCEVHHVIPWALGGPTDIDNLCLLCPFHHREFERRGWSVTMTRGRPQWRPPPWIDPDRTPILNTVHHLPEIVFQSENKIIARR